MGPFDRFNDRAKRVFALAQDEAVRFNHSYIETEHLLLGLVREREGVAAQVLQSLGLELSKVRTAVEFMIGRGKDAAPPSEITLSPRTKKVIELAIDEANKLGHTHVGTEHLLLGLVREGEGIASGVLQALGVSLERVRHQTIATLGQSAPTSIYNIVEATRAPDPRGSLNTDAHGKKRDWYCEDVLSGKLKVHVIHEDDLVLAFEHPYPEYVAHAVVIPKRHVASLMADEAADPTLLAAMIRAVQAVATSIGLHEQGFRLEANAGAPGVTPHMHWHVIGPGLPPPHRIPPRGATGKWIASVTGPAAVPPSSGGPFGRFSDSAKRVLALAQDEARRLQHNYIGTEHLLPAVVREGASPAARALAEVGVTLAKTRSAVEAKVGLGDAPAAEQTLSPRVKRIIELATAKTTSVSASDLFLAMIDEGGGLAVQLLKESTAVARLRARVVELMKE